MVTVVFVVMDEDSGGGLAYRSNHLTDQNHGGPPVAGGTGNEPLAVEIEEELGAGVDVHTCTVLPGRGTRSIVSFTGRMLEITLELEYIGWRF